MTSTLALLHALELTLWHTATRFDRILMDQTFAPDFHEFGRSGRSYTRAEMIFDLKTATPSTPLCTTSPPPQLSDTIAHTTYISELRTLEPAPNGPTARRSGQLNRPLATPLPPGHPLPRTSHP